MKTYIGTKMVKADPCPAWKDAGNHKIGDEGYKIVYPDGYESWSPKGVFEKAYLPLTVNDQLRTSAPSISQQMVDDFIVAREVTTMGNKCTVVRAVLRNGFEIVESSACVSAANYDETLGAEICMKKIKDKIWFLLGFLLQTAVTGIDRRAAQDAFEAELAEGNCCQSCGGCDCEQADRKMTFGDAICAMRRGLKVRRRGWNGRGIHIELQVPDEHSKMTYPYIYIDTTGLQTENPDATKDRVPWLASQTDMLAEDWEIAD